MGHAASTSSPNDLSKPKMASYAKLATSAQQEKEEIDAWARMLVAPQDNMGRAPASTPFLCSQARFVKSYDIPYSDTVDGSFAVTATPVIEGAVVITRGPQTAFPAQQIALTNAIDMAQEDNSSYLSGSIISVVDGGGHALTSTKFVDGGTLNGLLAGIPVCRVNLPNPHTATYTLTVSSGAGGAYYMRYGEVDAAAGTINWGVSIGIASHTQQTVTTLAALQGFVLQIIAANGTPTHRPALRMRMSLAYDSATIPVDASISNFNIVNSDLLEAGKVGNRRCVAISMLATNMAAPLVSGGEGVGGRVPASVLSSADPAQIMSAIKQLPEEKYWRSANIKDGGYFWWLPDDLSSYEPIADDTDLSPQNVLVYAGKMSDPGGLVRIQITFIYEFYSPVQLFSREYGPTYTPYVQALWKELTERPAASANAGHAALIAGALSLINVLSTFYNQNKTWLQPVLKQGAQKAYEKVKPIAEKRLKENQAKRAKQRDKKKKALSGKDPKSSTSSKGGTGVQS